MFSILSNYIGGHIKRRTTNKCVQDKLSGIYNINKEKNASLPVTYPQDVCNNRVASTAFNKSFKTCSCNTKWSIFIRVKLLKIVHNTPVL